jgi:hypothetical protein
MTKCFCLADNLEGTPFLKQFGGNSYSPKRRLGCIKKGADAPLLSEKGVPTKFTTPKLPTEFFFGIGMVNTRKIPTDTNQKYQIGIQL